MTRGGALAANKATIFILFFFLSKTGVCSDFGISLEEKLDARMGFVRKHERMFPPKFAPAAAGVSNIILLREGTWGSSRSDRHD